MGDENEIRSSGLPRETGEAGDRSGFDERESRDDPAELRRNDDATFDLSEGPRTGLAGSSWLVAARASRPVVELPAVPCVALAAEDLVVDLGRVRVVDALALTVRAGEVVGVFGPSGAGKSTLFRALAGELSAVRGKVSLFGEDVTRWPLWRRARKGLGYLPQTPSVLADLSVADNVRTFAALAPVFSRERGEALLEALDLGSRRAIKAGTLSGGERRKLEIVRTLGGAPRLILCDEPFAALDPAGKAKAGALLRAAADAGAAVLLSDHDVADALPLCDRALLLLSGSVACEAEPGAFAKHPVVNAHYVALS